MHLPCNRITEDSCSRSTGNVVFLPVVTAVRKLTAGVSRTYRYGKFTVAERRGLPGLFAEEWDESAVR